MEISLITSSTPTVSECLECGCLFDTVVVTDQFGSFQRDTICYYCNEYFQDLVYEMEMERWSGL